ncbi:MAG: hypothetical protein E6G39_08795 [Actinobacteria bacterium]|jgi:hypothetical protein|nr:MAG: hypothetical protein E6G39_08795 [Actinomycetota bacterium]
MSTVSPRSRSELLREIASLLLDDEIEGPLAVALADYSDGGPFDLSVRALPSNDPITALFGFLAPDEWVVFGVVTGGSAHHLDTCDGEPIPVRVAYLLDRRGLEVSVAKTGDAGAPMLIDLYGDPASLGRVPDTCRRVLGLPTSPPEADTQLLWALDWLDRVIADVIGRDLGAPPLGWRAIDLLHRGRPSRVAPWSIIRRECAAGLLEIGGISASDAQWMDDGMFSRQALAEYPELCETLVDLTALLPEETWHKMVDRLQRDHVV